MIRLMTAITTLLAFSVSAFSQMPNLSEEIKPDPSIKIGTFDNGIKYYIKKNKRPEGRAEIHLLIKAGSLQETKDQSGLAHFLEHMAFNGTKNFPKNELVKYLESTGMSFGGDINASTSWDQVYYTLQIPTDDKEMLGKGFQVLRDWLTDISLDPEQIEEERKIILEEWRVRTQNANYKSQEVLIKALAKGSKYEEFPIGDTAVFMNAPRDKFANYYKQWYRPDITAVIAVGDFDENEIMAQIKEKFESVPKVKKATVVKKSKIPERNEPLVASYENSELPFYSLTMAQRHPSREEGTYGEYYESAKENLINNMINKRFQELTIKGDGDYQQAFAFKTSFVGDLNTFLGQVILKADALESGYKQVLQELYRVKQHGFLASELERSKAEILTQVESMMKNAENMQSRSLAQEYGRNFTENEPIPGIKGDYEITKVFMENITIDEINQLANGLLTENSVVFHHSGPKDLLSEKQVLEIYNEVKNSKLEPWVDEAAAAKLMDFTPEPGSMVDYSMDEVTFTGAKGDKKSYEVVSYTLSNGVKVRMMNTDLNEDQVVMSAISKGGLLRVEDINDYYSATQADNFTNISGLGENDLTTMQKILAGKRVSVSPFISDYSEGLSGQASPDDLEEMFQMIHLYFTSPRMDETAINASISRLRESIKNAENDPNSVFSDSVTKYLYNNHPRQFNWTLDKIDNLNPSKAYEVYQERFADASDFHFYFVGNIDMGKINELINTYLASLPTQERDDKWVDRDIRVVIGSMKKSIKLGKEPNASVRVRIDGDYPNYGQEENMRMYALSRALSVLLIEDLREDKQIVYSIGAFDNNSFIPTKTYSMNVNFSCDPDRVEEGVKAITAQMEKLKNEKLDDTYMDRIREVVLSQYKKAFESNNYWAGYLRGVDWNGFEMDRAQKMLDIVNNLNADDIQSLAKKYLNTNDLKQITRYPENF